MKLRRFLKDIFDNLRKRQYSYVTNSIAKKCPDWLLKYNKASLMYTDTFSFPKSNQNGIIVKAADKSDIDDIIRISGLAKVKAIGLLDEGATCYLASRHGNKPESISWETHGKCYIRGLGFKYDFQKDGTYTFWSVTSPEARSQGLHNALITYRAQQAFDQGLHKFYCFIEFDNKISSDIRVRTGYQAIAEIVYLRFLFFNTTITKDILTGKRSFVFFLFRNTKDFMII